MNSVARPGSGLWGLLVVCLATASRAGGEQDDGRAAAEMRIKEHRQADAQVTIVDAEGKPVSGADAQIDQTDHAFLFGCNVFLWGQVGNERDEDRYRQQFAALFNYATLPFYWPNYERRRGEPGHESAEQVARWCKEYHIATKGHPLAWNSADPRWLPDDPDEVCRLQYGRIDDCVSRFRGMIDCRDVVNAAVNFERDEFRRRAPKMTRMWEKTGRIEFVFDCFAAARRANPQATLLINDYRTEPA